MYRVSIRFSYRVSIKSSTSKIKKSFTLGFEFLNQFDLVSRVSMGGHYNINLVFGQPISEDVEPVSVSVAFEPRWD